MAKDIPGFHASRINEWASDDPATARRPADFDTLWKLIQVWSEWAEKTPDRGRWNNLWVGAGLQRSQGATADELQPEVGRSHRETLNAGKSAYMRHIERIAPPRLVGRENELGELADFCTDPKAGPYIWWRAEAWAGKSALLATFVLQPPERIHVVSFFITARLAAQDTRQVFVTTLLDQLTLLTGKPNPEKISIDLQEAYLLDQLAKAAEICDLAGSRLVLVVDGLDEDRSVVTGPTAHSIAGVLPARPWAGMRVIVTGRPNPRVPDDVPSWHPLRDSSITRTLAPSSAAQDLQRLSEQEIRRLLGGTPTERGILGMLTVARGRLTAADLSELTEASLWEIEDVLRSVHGRTFIGQSEHESNSVDPDAFMIGHEELYASSIRYLGTQRLSACRLRLHSWADSYRAAGWPPETPEFLISGGYFSLLRELNDVARMVSLGGDKARHERLFDRIGGVAAARTEVLGALNANANNDLPDLTSACRLALYLYLDYFSVADAPWATRATRVDVEKRLGERINEIGRDAIRIAWMSDALASAGQNALAAEVAQYAESLARLHIEPLQQANMFADAAGMWVRRGDFGKAVRLASETEGLIRASRTQEPLAWPNHRLPETLAKTAEVFVIADSADRGLRAANHAIGMARTIHDVFYQAASLANIAGSLVRMNLFEHASTISREIRMLAPRIGNSRLHALKLVEVSDVLAKAGERRLAAQVADDAIVVSRAVPETGWRSCVLATVADALASTKNLQQSEAVAAEAEKLAESVTNLKVRSDAQISVAQALAKVGREAHASRIAADVEVAIQTVEETHARSQLLIGLVGLLAQLGQFDHAEAIVHILPEKVYLGWAMRVLCSEMVRAGALGRVEDIARADFPDRPSALKDLVAALIDVGELADLTRARRAAAGACIFGYAFEDQQLLTNILKLEPEAAIEVVSFGKAVLNNAYRRANL